MTALYRYALLMITLAAVILLLGACATTKEIPVTVEKVVESKVAVSSPCVKERPLEVVPLREKMTRQEFDSLSTDQREKLLGSQALDRKAYGDKLNVATAGCR